MNIDLLREEKRFFIDSSYLQALLKLLEQRYQSARFPTPYVFNIYFDTPERELPPGYTIKARNYVDNPINSEEHLDPEENYFFETKEESAVEAIPVKTKIRKSVPLKEIPHLAELNLQSDFQKKLQPYFATNFNRRHFSLENVGRVTVDTLVRYFLVSPEMKLKLIGSEDFVRVETKFDPETPTSIYQEIRSALEKFGARETISKKGSGVNFVSQKIVKDARENHVDPAPEPIKDLPGIEIEAKFNLTSEGTKLFVKLKEKFRTGSFEGFSIPTHFPYTNESCSLNEYYGVLVDGKSTEALKILSGGNSSRITIKSTESPVPNEFGINCILSRSEIKSPFAPYSTERLERAVSEREKQLGVPLNYIGRLQRWRKAFWIVDDKSKVYHISYDSSINHASRLRQFEVEYTGSLVSGTHADRNSVVQKIASLSSELFKYQPELQPTTLTKFEWLTSIEPSAY